MGVSVRQRQLLKQRVDELGQTEHLEIFRLLERHGVPYTRNSNGVFINLTIVPENVIIELQRFVDFCMSNKASLDEYDKRLTACKMSHNFTDILGPPPADVDAVTSHGDPPKDAAATSSTAGEASPNSAPCSHTAGVQADAAAVGTADPAESPASNTVEAPPPMAYKKMVNTKFYLAKKKFARRKVTDPTATERKEKEKEKDKDAPVTGVIAAAGGAALPDVLTYDDYLL